MKLFVEFDRFGLFAIFCYKFGFFSVFGTTFDGLLWTNELAVIYLWGLMLILLALTGPDIKLWSFFSFDRGSWHIFSLFLSIPILSNLSTVSFDGLSSIYTLMVGASPWLRRALTYSIWIMLSCDLWRKRLTCDKNDKYIVPKVCTFGPNHFWSHIRIPNIMLFHETNF